MKALGGEVVASMRPDVANEGIGDSELRDTSECEGNG